MFRPGLCLAIPLLIYASFSLAQDNVWLGITTDWDTPGNWDQAAVPGAGDRAIISGSVANQPVMATGGSVTVGEIQLNAGTSSASLTVQDNGGGSMSTFLTVGVLILTPGATGNAQLTIEGGNSVTVTTTATFHASPSHTSFLLGSGAFNMDTGSMLNVQDDEANPVDFQIPSNILGDALITGNLLLSGNCLVDGGMFTVQGSVNASAQLLVQSSSTLLCSGGGQLEGAGFLFDGGTTVQFDSPQNGTFTLTTRAIVSTPALIAATTGTNFSSSATVTLEAESDNNVWQTTSILRNEGTFIVNGAAGSNRGVDLDLGAEFTNAGTLMLMSDSGGQADIVGSAELTNEAGGTINVVGGIASAGISCPLDNQGMIRVSSGTLILANNYVQSATTAVVEVTDSSGTFSSADMDFQNGQVTGSGTLFGNVTNRAQFRPGGMGAAGTLTINGDYTQIMGSNASLGVVELEFSSAVSYDQINIFGTASLGHRLEYKLIDSYTPAVNTLFDNVFSVSGTRSGSFNQFVVPTVVTNSDRYFLVEYEMAPANVSIRFKSHPVPTAQSFNAQPGVQYNGTLASTDADGDVPALFQIVNVPAKGTVQILNTVTGAFRYTPNAGQTGSDSFTFNVSDGNILSRTDALVTITLAAPPVISSTTAGPEVARPNGSITFTAVASDPASLPLTFHWDFMDGSTGSGNPITHAFASPGVYSVSLTVSNGSSSAQSTVSVTVLAPNSGAENILNVGDGKPPVENPLNGISLAVSSSNGGVVELTVDVDALNRDTFDVDTAFDGILGRRANRKGLRPTEKFTEPGVAVATTVATDAGTTNERGKARRQIVVSSREVGQAEPFSAPPVSRTISTQSMKGKFLFSSTKPDQFTFSGTFELPTGLDVSQPRTLQIGIGNIIDAVELDAKGKARNPALNRILKAQIKYPRVPKDTKQTSAGQLAKITLTMKGVNFSGQGFDTEGISATLRGEEEGAKSVPRSIQTAISFGGSTWEGSIPVSFKLTKNADSGTILGRRAN